MYDNETWQFEERRTVNSSCEFQRKAVKGLEMPDMKQSHLGRFGCAKKVIFLSSHGQKAAKNRK